MIKGWKQIEDKTFVRRIGEPGCAVEVQDDDTVSRDGYG